MKNTIVISAFPACGKTWMYQHSEDKIILDSDSSQFSWIKDADGNNTKDRNPEFPDNYIKHIKDNIGIADYILVSSHKDVREALKKANIDFFLVYPNRSLLNEWIGRYYQRKNNGFQIDVLIRNWNEWITQCENESEDDVLCIELSSGEHLSDAINRIEWIYSDLNECINNTDTDK